MDMLLSEFCSKFGKFLDNEAKEHYKNNKSGSDAKFVDFKAIENLVNSLSSLESSLLKKNNVMHKTKVHLGHFGFSER